MATRFRFVNWLICAAAGLTLTGATAAEVWQGYTTLPHNLTGHPVDILDGCPMKGDSPRPELQQLDLLKNRHDAPTNLDPIATLDAMKMAKSGSGAFDVHKGATIEGYLVHVQQEHGESCNCHSASTSDGDFHCFLADTPNPASNDRIVVEVTPRLRYWALQKMRSLVGHKVRITGWLLDDVEHVSQSEADSPGRAGNWRASCWEIHPVTNIEVAQ